ncbi:MAG: dihydrodipicolinate synthase family protein [Firmicutes bacterium]|nr:dihydrodipicolinate synthase family protein [Bacillota bacterium]
MKIKGSIAPNLTFFDKEGNIDEETTRRHQNWILENGVNGLFVTGTYGSGYLMSPEQRIRIYEIAKEVSDAHPGTFVIAHVGANDTATSVYLTKKAVEMGLDAISAINPYTFKYTDDELIGYYQALVEAAGGESGLPVFAYNNPDLTHKVIDYKMIKKLKAIGIAAVKDSSINIQLATNIYNDNKLHHEDFKYISGTTTGWLAFRKLDCDTVIAGVCNYAPELVAGLYRLSMAGDEEKAMKAYELVNGVSSKVKTGNSLVSSHIALKARGFEPTYMKAPLTVDYQGAADKLPALKEAIDEAVAAMKELEG